MHSALMMWKNCKPVEQLITLSFFLRLSAGHSTLCKATTSRSKSRRILKFLLPYSNRQPYYIEMQPWGPRAHGIDRGGGGGRSMWCDKEKYKPISYLMPEVRLRFLIRIVADYSRLRTAILLNLPVFLFQV